MGDGYFGSNTCARWGKALGLKCLPALAVATFTKAPDYGNAVRVSQSDCHWEGHHQPQSPLQFSCSPLLCPAPPDPLAAINGRIGWNRGSGPQAEAG